MQGTIQDFGKSQSGKPKVKIDGQWYSAKSIENMAVGRQIDFEAHEFQFNGKQFWGLDNWGYMPAPAPAQPPTQPSSVRPATPQSPQASAAPRASTAVLTEPELRFISNCVGNAIAAKTIADPIDLIAWVKGARAALESLTDQGF